MDEKAVSSTMGVAAIIATVVVLSATVVVTVSGLAKGDLTSQFSAPQFEISEDEDYLSLRFTAGDPVPVGLSKFMVNINGAQEDIPLTFWQDYLSDEKFWRAGDDLCIIGPTEDCLRSQGKVVGITLVVRNTLLWQSEEQLDPWAVTASGLLQTACAGPVDVTVLGTAITWGAGGPDVPVGVDLDDGTGFKPLFDDDAVSGGEVHHIEMARVGTQFAVRGHADYNWFHASYESGQSDPHVLVLRDGDAVPQIPAFDNQAAVEDFVQAYVDTASGTVSIKDTQTIVLFEFNPSVTSVAADWQDLVVLFDFVGPLCQA